MELLVLLLLPVLASCSITLDIKAGNSIATSSVTLIGTDSHIISDNEKISFGVTDANLKRAAEKYSGSKPKDVFLHSPTPWNDLYQTYGWKQVKRILKGLKSKVLDVTSEESVVNLKELNNNSTIKIYFDADVTTDVENSVSNTWNKGGCLNIKEPMAYNILTLGSVAGPEFRYKAPWGIDGMQVKKITIGASTAEKIYVDPGEWLQAEMIATKVTVIVEVDYSASLTGHVACNYPKKLNGHHFWRYDVNSLLEAGKLNKTVKSSELIKIRYYTNPKMVIKNKDTHKIVSSLPGFMTVKK